MEEIMFYTYKKFWKEKDESVFKQIFKLPKTVIIMMAAVLAMVILGIMFSFKNVIVAYICFGVEFFICIISIVYMERYRIKTSDKKIVEYRDNYRLLHSYLCNAGLGKSEDCIKTLLVRIQARADKLDTKIKQLQNIIWRIASLVIFPMLIAVFSEWIDGLSAPKDIVPPTLATISILGIIGGIFYLVYVFLSLTEKRESLKLERFIADLQGILDSQFPDGPIYNPIQYTKPSLN